MNTRLIALMAFTLCFCWGCQITDKSARRVLLNLPAEKPRTFVLLGAAEYEGELVFALAENGIIARPVAVPHRVAEIESPGRMLAYGEAGDRYALKIAMIHDRSWTCVFSGGHRIHATMSIVDLTSNETLAVLRQTGPDGPCPPLTPVWTLLARELDRLWQ
jgi:hypothetical protein